MTARSNSSLTILVGLAVAVICLPRIAMADDVVVILQNGRRITGAVDDADDQGEWVVVTRSLGSVRIARADVLRIERLSLGESEEAHAPGSSAPDREVVGAVILRDGRRVAGGISVRQDSVSVGAPLGSIRLSRSDVARIEIDEAATARQRELVDAAEGGGAVERRALARHFEELGWSHRAREAYRSILDIAPDDEQAHLALGDVRDEDGRWLTKDELALAQGLVRYRGRFVEPEEQARLMAAADAAREKAKPISRWKQRREAKKERERVRREWLAWRPVTANVPRWDEDPRYRRRYGSGWSGGSGWYGYDRFGYYGGAFLIYGSHGFRGYGHGSGGLYTGHRSGAYSGHGTAYHGHGSAYHGRGAFPGAVRGR